MDTNDFLSSSINWPCNFLGRETKRKQCFKQSGIQKWPHAPQSAFAQHAEQWQSGRGRTPPAQTSDRGPSWDMSPATASLEQPL